LGECPLTLCYLCRVGMLGELPEELLWTIMRSLDVPTLCMVRMVCKRFRQCGAGYFKTLQLDSATLHKHPGTDFTQFSGVTHASARVRETHLRQLVQTSLAPVVTHVELLNVSPEGRHHADRLAQLALLPNLRSLTTRADMHIIPLLPTGLGELILRKPLWHKALSRLSRLSGLTSLVLQGCTVYRDSPRLEGLTALSSLRSLELHSFPPLPVLSTFTTLTSLTWALDHQRIFGIALQSLAHLTGLSRLEVSTSCRGDLTPNDLACIARLTRLTSLDVSKCSLAHLGAASSALAPLTRLVCLGLFTGWVSGRPQGSWLCCCKRISI
jgi:Leucine-rich repeat (LRR) protein